MRRVIVVSVLAGALLFVARPADAGGGCHRAGSTAGSGSTVELSMNCMSPSVLHTESNEVTFVNRDEVTHNVYGAAWGRDVLRTGDSFTQRLTEGTHLYSCTLHPGMIGAVVVGDGKGDGALLAAAPVVAADDTSSNTGPLAVGLLIGAAVGAIGAVALRRVVSRSAA